MPRLQRCLPLAALALILASCGQGSDSTLTTESGQAVQPATPPAEVTESAEPDQLGAVVEEDATPDITEPSQALVDQIAITFQVSGPSQLGVAISDETAECASRSFLGFYDADGLEVLERSAAGDSTAVPETPSELMDPAIGSAVLTDCMSIEESKGALKAMVPTLSDRRLDCFFDQLGSLERVLDVTQDPAELERYAELCPK